MVSFKLIVTWRKSCLIVLYLRLSKKHKQEQNVRKKRGKSQKKYLNKADIKTVTVKRIETNFGKN